MIHYNINSNVPSNIDVSLMTLRSQWPSISLGDGGSLASDIGIKFTNCVDFKVHNCRFMNFGNGAIDVRHRDYLARGLIYSNQFYHNAKGYDGLGLGYGVVIYAENLKWITNVKFGGPGFIFIEDNTFDYHRHSIAAGGCALYVARYNTITNNIINDNVSTQALDAHGARGNAYGSANYFATRAVELYNNTITNTTFLSGTTINGSTYEDSLIERAIYIRGGEAIIHDNTIIGYRFGGGLTEEGDLYWGSSYPLKYASGYISGLIYGSSHTGTDLQKGDGDFWYYSNTFSTYNGNCATFHNYKTANFTVDRDYHLVAKPNYTTYTYPHPKR
jgi:hypothetical protein